MVFVGSTAAGVVMERCCGTSACRATLLQGCF